MYVAEYLPRLSQVSIKLEFPEDTKCITVLGIRRSNLFIQAANTYTIPLPIQQASSLEQAKIGAISIKNGIMSINLSVGSSGAELEDSSFMSLSKSDNQKWSVKDLVKKTPKDKNNINEFSFCCARCDEVIIESRTMRFLDMPSEFWHEMMDFWHCHKPHEHYHNDNDKNYNGKLVPAAGNVHIGSSYLLTTDRPTECPKCGTTLGVKEDNCVRIYKWNVKLKYSSITETFPAYAFVFYTLLDKVNASAIRKLSLKSGSSSLNVWVSNLGLNVSVTDTMVLTNALKILYMENPEKLEDEVLEVPQEVYTSFIEQLRYLNCKLPPGSNTSLISEKDALEIYYITYLLTQ